MDTLSETNSKCEFTPHSKNWFCPIHPPKSASKTRQKLHTAKSPLKNQNQQQKSNQKKQPKKSAFGKEHCHFSSIMVSKAEKRLVFREGSTHTHTSCSEPRLPITSRWQLSGVAMPRGCNFLNLQIVAGKNRGFFMDLQWCFFCGFPTHRFKSFAQVFYGIFFVWKEEIRSCGEVAGIDSQKWFSRGKSLRRAQRKRGQRHHRYRCGMMWENDWIMLSRSGITSWITIYIQKKYIQTTCHHLHLIPGGFFSWQRWRFITPHWFRSVR